MNKSRNRDCLVWLTMFTFGLMAVATPLFFPNAIPRWIVIQGLWVSILGAGFFVMSIADAICEAIKERK